MQKIAFILFLVITTSGCSVLKNRSGNYIGDYESIKSSDNIQVVKNKNITKNNFYIEKAEIEVITPAGSDKFLGSVKFEKPGKYLISLKSFTGIEAARILQSGDTILANDRIKRKLYFGSPDYVLRKYGISESMIPVLFGDFIGGKLADENTTECIDGRLNVAYAINGIRISYVIDCKENKIISAVTENNFQGKNISINYSGFKKVNDLIFPGRIEVTDTQRNTTIKIKILKITPGLKNEIEFLPGNKYELIRLL